MPSVQVNKSLYIYVESTIPYKLTTYKYNPVVNPGEGFVFDFSFSTGERIDSSLFVSVNNVGVFRVTEDYDNFAPAFSLYRSASLDGEFHSSKALAHPPIDSMGAVDLCSSNGGVYLREQPHSSLPRRSRNYDPSRQPFTEEEIQRGIYFYNIEQNRWLPVPAMISRPLGSSMTALDDNLLYVIGGSGSSKIVQMLDHRENRWQTKATTLNNHLHDIRSCVHDGNIYVRSVKYFETYDPVANKWENIGGLRNRKAGVSKIISYNNQVWQFRSYDIPNYIDVYEPRTATWYIRPSMISDMRESISSAIVW